MVFLVFLALKNTPLAPLTAKSYDKLRPLHKVAGYTCIFMSCMHGIVYLIAWSESDKLEKMTKSKNLAGAIAGMAMVVIGFSTITKFMRKFFEREILHTSVSATTWLSRYSILCAAHHHVYPDFDYGRHAPPGILKLYCDYCHIHCLSLGLGPYHPCCEDNLESSRKLSNCHNFT